MSEDNSSVDETFLGEVSSKSNILVVGCSEFSGQFSPFYAESAVDSDVVKMTSVKLLSCDREGAVIEDAIDGEIFDYNGVDYKYTGISNMSITVSEKGSVVCDFEIREDVVFGDGEILNADDVIFTMYVLSDPSYDGPATFYTLPIEGMAEYRNDEADYIKGIVKTGEFAFSIMMAHYDASLLSHLLFTVAPMHYYGNAELYNYDKNMFGFEKGNLDSVKAMSSAPLGAGPYKFDRYENGIVYFERNNNFYKGASNIPFVEFREIADSDKLAELLNGNIHITDPSLENSVVDSILEINGDVLSGSVLKTYVYDNTGYGYIGICADNVKVGEEKDSNESKYLRKALSTLFSVYRESAIENYYGVSAEVINYPISSTSWAAPSIDDDDYEIAFSEDINGDSVYSDEMDETERYAAALDAAKEYLIAAGFTFDSEKGIFISAPNGAELSYEVTVHGEGKGNHPTYDIFLNAGVALSKIGITLTIDDVTDSAQLWDKLDNGKCQIWAAAWNSALDPDLYQLYHSDNIDGNDVENGSNDYVITDSKLDSLIMAARISMDTEYRKSVYKDCFDIILDWGVEIPVYQRKNAVVVDTYSVDVETLGSDYTACFTWIDDIHNFQMNEVYE